LTISSNITRIEDNTFEGCSSLTKLTIPDDVTSIGGSAFKNCNNLLKITIPSNVTSIGYWAFSGCESLTSIEIPNSVTSIAYGSFENCSGLKSAFFQGNAPQMGGNDFVGAASNFTVYYWKGSTGFTSPTWNAGGVDYSSLEVDGDENPAAPWTLSYGYQYDTSLNVDANNDGVSLLVAYALNFDPHQILSDRVPVATLDETKLSLLFNANNPRVNYIVETSTDMVTWTSDGVTTTFTQDEEGQSIAEVPRDGQQRFLRLVLSLK
jgi:hypothetical protein